MSDEVIVIGKRMHRRVARWVLKPISVDVIRGDTRSTTTGAQKASYRPAVSINFGASRGWFLTVRYVAASGKLRAAVGIHQPELYGHLHLPGEQVKDRTGVLVVADREQVIAA